MDSDDALVIGLDLLCAYMCWMAGSVVGAAICAVAAVFVWVWKS